MNDFEKTIRHFKIEYNARMQNLSDDPNVLIDMRSLAKVQSEYVEKPLSALWAEIIELATEVNSLRRLLDDIPLPKDFNPEMKYDQKRVIEEGKQYLDRVRLTLIISNKLIKIMEIENLYDDRSGKNDY